MITKKVEITHCVPNICDYVKVNNLNDKHKFCPASAIHNNGHLRAFHVHLGQMWGAYAPLSIIAVMMSRINFFFHQSPAIFGCDIPYAM